MNEKKYILMHQNVPVLKYSADEYLNITDISECINKEHIPLGTIRNKEIDTHSLSDWLSKRVIPASRAGIDIVTDSLGIDRKRLAEEAFNLSLSDQYWVMPEDRPLCWEKINFFDNEFSEDIGKLLFNEYEGNLDISLISPDNTSEGNLPKRWKIIDGKRYLLKGGSNPYQQEPYNEVIASMILERLKIRHVDYKIIDSGTIIYSACENFLDKNSELVTGYDICRIEKKRNDFSDLKHFLYCCDELEIEGAEDFVNKVLTFDYLIANKDRHWRNFGAVRDARTLEYKGMAPVFDNGSSLWYNIMARKINGFKLDESKPFKNRHRDQIKLVTDFSWYDDSVLRGAEDEIYKILSMSDDFTDERKNAICNGFCERYAALERFIENR